MYSDRFALLYGPRNAQDEIHTLASYLSRNPVSLKRLVYVDGEHAVIYRALKPNPRLGQNFVALETSLPRRGGARRVGPG